MSPRPLPFATAAPALQRENRNAPPFARRKLFLQSAVIAALLWLHAAPVRADDEFVGVGTPGGAYSLVSGISADGNVVVGTAGIGGAERAYRFVNGSITDLGTLGGSFSSATAVSANGAAVVGWSRTGGDAADHAFRWMDGSMIDLGTLGGDYSYANAVSAEGGVVVGTSTTGSAPRAFRWTQTDGMIDLGTLGGTYSTAIAVSADGAVVVGDGNTAASEDRAFRWTQADGMIDLGTLGGNYSAAVALSADGGAVAGNSYITGNTAFHAFRWTQADGMVDLGTLGGSYSSAAAISADGRVVVGHANLAGDTTFHAYRWADGSIADLGTLGGSYSYSYAVSADGSVVLGMSEIGGTTDTDLFRWTQAGGMQSVPAWLATAGVTLPSGWRLSDGGSDAVMNADGSVLAGTGLDPDNQTRAWLARVGGAGTGILLDMVAFNATLAEAGSRAIQDGVVVTDLALYGSHHRTLLDNGLARRADSNGTCAWSTADAARQNNTDTRMSLFEVGVCKDIAGIAKLTRVGVGVGQSWARQGWTLGGGAKYRGQYLVAEAASAFDNGVEASVLAYYARFDTDLRRHYLNGAAVDVSSASPDATSTAMRARLDWKDHIALAGLKLSPYLVYTRTETTLDAYTESGGAFPAAFDAITTCSTDLRLGITFDAVLSSAMTLKLSLEGAHRFESNVGAVNGQIIGLGSFNVPGRAVKQDWLRVILDLDYRLTQKSALTFSLKSATAGSDASWGGSLGYRVMF